MPDLLLATAAIDRYEGNQASVYRISDGYGSLLYIGQTNCPLKRVKDHRWMYWYGWWQWAAEIRVDLPLIRHEAQAAELAAIHSECPLYNRTGRIPNTEPAGAGEIGRPVPPPGQRNRCIDTPPTWTLRDFDRNWTIRVYAAGSGELLVAA
jgi:hypothetical protein